MIRKMIGIMLNLNTLITYTLAVFIFIFGMFFAKACVSPKPPPQPIPRPDCSLTEGSAEERKRCVQKVKKWRSQTGCWIEDE